jgi:hypothetical protein
MAAHTSPLYVDCRGYPRRGADLSEPIAVLDGTQAWLEQLAPVSDPIEAERLRRFIEEGRRRLQTRSH